MRQRKRERERERETDREKDNQVVFNLMRIPSPNNSGGPAWSEHIIIERQTNEQSASQSNDSIRSVAEEESNSRNIQRRIQSSNRLTPGSWSWNSNALSLSLSLNEDDLLLRRDDLLSRYRMLRQMISRGSSQGSASPGTVDRPAHTTSLRRRLSIR